VPPNVCHFGDGCGEGAGWDLWVSGFGQGLCGNDTPQDWSRHSAIFTKFRE